MHIFCRQEFYQMLLVCNTSHHFSSLIMTTSSPFFPSFLEWFIHWPKSHCKTDITCFGNLLSIVIQQAKHKIQCLNNAIICFCSFVCKLAGGQLTQAGLSWGALCQALNLDVWLAWISQYLLGLGPFYVQFSAHADVATATQRKVFLV